MLNVEEVNQFVDCFFQTLDEKTPTIGPFYLGSVEGTGKAGAHGSVILGALINGDLEGKLTLILEWETAFAIAEAASQVKVDAFDDIARNTLEEIFREIAGRIANGFSVSGKTISIYPLPTLVDTSVRLTEQSDVGAVKIPFLSNQGKFELYLAFK